MLAASQNTPANSKWTLILFLLLLLFFFLSYLFYYYKCIVTIIITIILQYFHLNFIDLNLTVTVVVQKHMLKNVIYLTFLIENDLK